MKVLNSSETRDEVILKATGITKVFPGTMALNKVDFDLKCGEVHALVGENGAGKSTLMNIFSGVYSPDAGKIKIEGKDIEIKNPRNAQELGIGIVHQELNLVEKLTIGENIFANKLPSHRFFLINWKELESETRKLLSMFDIDLPSSTRVDILPLATKRMIEILMALSRDLKILILDEPTAALSDHEVEYLFSITRRLKKVGVGLIYISHHLKEVFKVSDRITVLRDGCKVSTYETESVDEEQIITAVIGEKLKSVKFEHKTSPPINSKPLIQLDGLSGESFTDINLKAYSGEILSLSGLAGDGRQELGETLYGLRKKLKGLVYISGEKVNTKTPWEAVRQGIGWIPEDRKLQGLFLKMTITENIVAPKLQMYTKHGILNFYKQQKITEKLIHEMKIKALSPEQIVQSVSGGNQQKILLAKWLSIKPTILIANEPTRGVDVGARVEIHQKLREISLKGILIILISSDLGEILAISDRIIIFHKGKIVKELQHKEASEETIIAYANMSSQK